MSAKDISKNDLSNNATKTAKDSSGNVLKDSSGNVIIDLSGSFLNNLLSSKKEDDKSSPLFVRVFNNSYIMFMVWFLGIYLVIYAFFGVFLNPKRDPEMEQRFSTTIDMLAFGSIFVLIVFQAFTTNNLTQDGFVDGVKKFLKDFYGNQLSLFSTMLFLLTFYLLIFILRIPTGSSKPLSIKFIEFFGLIFLLSVFIYDFFKYFLGYDMLDILGDPIVNNLLNSVGAPLNVVENEQVFNVSNNLYTYDDAKAVCKAFDARLSTYDEIEAAYNQGAEWCNYGWSEGQMAFFPTQKDTWKKLQESELNKNSCGRPGINGGHFANPNIKFGVNCFGRKPKPSDLEKSMMATAKETPIPQTKEEIALNEKVKYYQENGDKLLQVNSFNKEKWSRF
uniref:Link domain-containing protein n=1 Tax=viral metagenome TaxID=1070528 RepID=A0A6C0HJN5_9ZZZZ